ncbi:hypothetical protein K474DRAFT_1514397 [Panus rudis PR-1116 ss-1]|nr:hypothetical protein K474DRAFT_1514397 [Panus rudis PR-1116 ss-1]
MVPTPTCKEGSRSHCLSNVGEEVIPVSSSQGSHSDCGVLYPAPMMLPSQEYIVSLMPARATPNGSAPSKPPSQKDTSAVQKKHTTRARNRRAQELEEQQIVNEELGTRSSKVKAYSIVKEFIQSQRRMSTTRGRQRAPQKRSKDVIQSDEESDIAPPPPKKQYISESQPVMNLQPMASDNEHGYGSDTEPRGGTSNFRRYTQGYLSRCR